MLTHWNKLLNTDCVVVQIKDKTVYPIFRVGYNTLMSISDYKLVNEQIAKCDHIDVMIRDPEERFVSGVNEYCRQNSLDINTTCALIAQGRLYNRHFTPQFIWLMHLNRFYKGKITLRTFDYIDTITDRHINKSKFNKHIPVSEAFVKVDKELIKHCGDTLQLDEVVRRYRHVLS